MRLGFGLPQLGPGAGPGALVDVAQRAEAMGFDSVWTIDRLLWPVNPRTPYMMTPDGSLPEAYRHVLDPIETLSFVAARTERVSLGTSVLNLPYYNPTLLARQLTAVDVLSGGRLIAGFGLGWSVDEHETTGSAMGTRGKRADEALEILHRVWKDEVVEFSGDHYQMAASHIDLKPVQKPHPPIYMAAFTPAAMQRTAKYADGWNPAGIPFEGMLKMFGGIRQMAEAGGRDPASLKLVVRANVAMSDSPLSEGRNIFSGSDDELVADIAQARAIGVDELFFDAGFSPGVESTADLNGAMERLWGLAQRS